MSYIQETNKAKCVSASYICVHSLHFFMYLVSIADFVSYIKYGTHAMTNVVKQHYFGRDAKLGFFSQSTNEVAHLEKICCLEMEVSV